MTEEPREEQVPEDIQVFEPGQPVGTRYTLTHEERRFLNEQRDRINKYGHGGQTT